MNNQIHPTGRSARLLRLLCSTAMLAIAVPLAVLPAAAADAEGKYFMAPDPATGVMKKTDDLEAAAKSWRDLPEFKNSAGLGIMKAEYAFARGMTGKDPISGTPLKIGIVDSGFYSQNKEFSPSSRFTAVVATDPLASAGSPTALGVSGEYNSNNDGHGTKVTGVIGAARNGTGVLGLAFDANIYVGNTNASDSFLFGANVDPAFPASTPSYMAGVYAAVAGQGVRLISNSWGSQPSNHSYGNLSSLIGVYNQYRTQTTWLDGAMAVSTGSPDHTAIINNFSAGNSGYDNASIRGSIPYFHPELEGSWMTTTGYSATASAPTQIYNRCGVAKYWCVMAPTIVNSTDIGPNAISSGFNGTSAAAPHASGALADIMVRFPYLANPEALTVLFTTADNMVAKDGVVPTTSTRSTTLTKPSDADVPNVTTGWGLINEKTAMEGPKQLLGHFDAALPGGTIDTWSNNRSDAAIAARRVEEKAEIDAWAGVKASLLAKLRAVPDALAPTAADISGVANAKALLQEAIRNNTRGVYTAAGFNAALAALKADPTGAKLLALYQAFRPTWPGGYSADTDFDTFVAGRSDADLASAFTIIARENIILANKPIQAEIDIRQARVDALMAKTDTDYIGVFDKSGDGSLTLEGNATYRGNTLVRGGLLTVDGSLASKTIVDATGIGETATNYVSGATSVGTLGGHLVVNGKIADVDVNSGGVMDVNSMGATGDVAVTGGTANLGGKSGRLTLAGSGAAVVTGATGDATLDFSTLFVLDKGITGKIAATNSTLGIDAGGQSGDVTLSGGTARFNGDSGLVSIADGRIDGIGTLAGLVAHKNGVVAPGNSIGTLKITGDATFEDGSQLDIEIAPDGRTDRIEIGHIATLGGVVRVLSNVMDPVAVTETWKSFSGGPRPFLTAAGIVDTFKGIEGDDFTFLDFNLVYSPTSVALSIDKRAFATMAMTENQARTANAIETLAPGDELFDTMIMLKSPTTPGAGAPATEILAAASGDIHAILAGSLLDSGRFLSDATGSRLRQTMGGVLTTASINSTDGKAARDLDGGFWTSAYGSWQSEDSDGNAPGIDGSAGGFFLGADAALVDEWRFGAFAGIGHSSVDTGTMNADIDSYTIGLYGGRSFDQLKLSFEAAYGRHEIDTTRSVLGVLAKGDYAANALEFYGEVGYTVEMPLAAFEPFAGLAYSHLSTDSFTETGAGAFSLSSKGDASDLAATTLGLRVTADLPFESIHGRVFGSAGWRHAFGDVTPETTLAFAGGADFTNKGLPIATNALAIEAGLEVDLSSTASLGLSYAGQFAKDSSDHTVKANFNLKF